MLNKETFKSIEVSLGLFVGYGIGALINVLAFDKNWKEAITDQKLVMLFAGVVLGLFLYKRNKRKEEQN